MPRILRIETMDSTAWPAALGRAATLGFDTLLLPAGSLLSAEFATAASGLGIALFLDVPVDAPLPGTAPAPPFTTLPAPTLDPRQPATPSERPVLAVGSLKDIAALAATIGPQLTDLATAGIAGVRLSNLSALPAWGVVPFLHAVRDADTGLVLFADLRGLAWPVIEAVGPGVLDLVACSLPFWDGQAEWFWNELDLLRRLAPVVADAGPFPERVGLAAVLAEGWMAADGSVGDAETLNRVRSTTFAALPWTRLVSAPGPVLALLRTDHADPRQAHRAAIAVTAIAPAPALPAAPLLAAAEGVFGPFRPTLGAGQAALAPGGALDVPPGSLQVFEAGTRVVPVVAPLNRKRAEAAALVPRLAIEAPSPCVENGRFPARQVVGTEVIVEADIIGDGHDHLAAALRWQAPGEEKWSEVRMHMVNNDRWTARFPLERMGVHRYVVEAWKDTYDTFTDELSKKHAAGVPITLELQEGAALVRAAAARGKKPGKVLSALLRTLDKGDADTRRAALLAPKTVAAMQEADDRPHAVSIDPLPVQAERSGAAFASWYEVFPRSMSDDPDRHGTFRDVVRHLPRIEAMGFDVLYFPPFHPIGLKNRKGRNNTLTPGPDDVGSPYAIGSKEGGHEALHPELGSIEDFQFMRAAAARHGLELAMDFAIQCSPDHPWLADHKEWFTWRPDGTIRYAENPPKKYEDIVNVDFYAPGAVPDLWLALANAVMYWAGQGIRLFRVDNPHTKALPFWEWMIAEVQARYPDSVFLAEAFTRPKVMYRLAKVGFSQSYTYFTWRSTAAEFREYLTELTQGPPRHFFRPHFFVNTPDINPVPLQTSPRSGFLTRAALAATLSGLWGVYNGFELCESTPVPGKEEYLDSEKYQIRAWDWDRPGNIVAEIAQLNAIRKRNPALHTHLGVTFLDTDNPDILAFEKATPDRSNVLLVAINTSLHTPGGGSVAVPFWRWPSEPARLVAEDLVSGTRETWSDRRRFFSLSSTQPYAIWRLTPAGTDA